VIGVATRLAGVMKIDALGGMQNSQSSWFFNHSSASSVIEYALGVVVSARPVVDAVQRKDRDLASQLRRAMSSICLNLAEGFGCSGGNARLRFETAQGSLREVQAAIRLAVAWGYVSLRAVEPLLDAIDRLGGRVFGLVRR
jgi:four helix bundle protein